LSNRASETPGLGEEPARTVGEQPRLAVSLGVFASTSMLIVWLAFAIHSRNTPQSTTPETWLRIAEMAALAGVGLLASLKQWTLIMLAVFLASFYPVGLYLLGVPSVFRLIGVADLLYLVATVWLLIVWLRAFSEKGRSAGKQGRV
jgi:hypothetical protein